MLLTSINITWYEIVKLYLAAEKKLVLEKTTPFCFYIFHNCHIFRMITKPCGKDHKNRPQFNNMFQRMKLVATVMKKNTDYISIAKNGAYDCFFMSI